MFDDKDNGFEFSTELMESFDLFLSTRSENRKDFDLSQFKEDTICARNKLKAELLASKTEVSLLKAISRLCKDPNNR